MTSRPFMLLIALITAGTATTPARAQESLSFDAVRAIPVQHDGRWPPLDTVARDLVEKVTGNEFYGDGDAVSVLLAWTFNAPVWRERELISISNAELRRELRLTADRTSFSYAELTSHRHFHTLVDELSNVPSGQKLDPLQAKVSDIHQKLLLLRTIFSGRALTIVPHATDPRGAWSPVADLARSASPRATIVTRRWADLGAALLAEDGSRFASTSTALANSLKTLPAAYYPTPERIAVELRYNAGQLFRLAWQVMVAGTLLALVAVVIKRRWMDAIATAAMLAGFGVLTYGLALRWQIAGRIPASNMFESLLFLSWGMGAFAIVSMLVIRHRTVPLTASFMGAVALMLADLLPMNHFIRPITPVLLDTYWMSIHVPIIMISYSVLTLGVLIAHVQLVTMAVFPARHRYAEAIDTMHYWYVHVGSILLLAGIITGSMWAASSWGRYWGWDPKEVWSLVALLGYLAILHVRIQQRPPEKWVYVVGGVLTIGVFATVISLLAPLSTGAMLGLPAALGAMAVFVFATGHFATALKSIMAFWLIIMTYVGVNYILGIGLHSYGFGTGAVARHMFTIAGMDLAVVALLTCVYIVRRRGTPPPMSIDRNTVPRFIVG